MEYHKIIYHQRPTEIQQLLVHAQFRKDVADAIWAPGENATAYGYEWHFGFPLDDPSGHFGPMANPHHWHGYIVDVEPNPAQSARWRATHDPDGDPILEFEDIS